MPLTPGIQKLSPPFTRCVTLKNLPDLPLFQFPHFQKGGKKPTTCFIDLTESNIKILVMNIVENLAQGSTR